MDLVRNRIEESVAVKERMLKDDALIAGINQAAFTIRTAISCGGKILFCGNGGSASDALHLTAEFVGRFQKNREALAAICLNADVATMTSISNDYGYASVFARAVEALMKPEDVIVGISTSGNSENVYLALCEASQKGGTKIALLGMGGGRIKSEANIALVVPSEETARIQEAHIMIGHIICELVEQGF